MKKDLLKEYAALKTALVEEKGQIEARLQEINQVLGESSFGMGRPKRIRNEISLKEAVTRVTTGKPMTKEEILEEIQKLGYKFTASNPVNSLNVVLYGRNPKFRNESGRFSPASNQNKAATAKA